MYIVTIAARIRRSSLASEARNASAAPWKPVRTESGSSSALASASIAPTAAPSETPGARLKEMVAAGNWPFWLLAYSAGFFADWVIWLKGSFSADEGAESFYFGVWGFLWDFSLTSWNAWA